MTEKRFELAYCDYDWWAICDNESQYKYQKKLGMSGQEVVDLMNEINDENKEFREENEYLKPLANENSSYIDDMEDDIISFRQEIKKLKNENKELKEQLKDCTKKAKEEIRKQREENAIRWANMGR